MNDHPIQGLMRTALESLREMIDVNTVVGDPVETRDGQVIIPVSRISLGFAAGGAEYGPREQANGQEGGDRGGFPFGGGSGAGVSVQPVGFLVVGDEIRMLPVHGGTALERVAELVPRVIDRMGWRPRTRAAAGDDQAPDDDALDEVSDAVRDALD